MVLGLKPIGETNYLKNQVFDRTKVLHGPSTQTYGKISYLRRILSHSVLGPNTRKRLRLWRPLGRWRNALLLSDPQGLFILGYISSDDYFLHSTEHSAIISFSLGFTTLFQVGLIVQDSFNKFIITSFFLVRVSALSIVFSGRHYYVRQL